MRLATSCHNFLQPSTTTSQYTAHRYDFAPNHLFAAKGDLVHFQWEGSDYNPRQAPNNGEGGPPDNADNDPNQATLRPLPSLLLPPFLPQTLPCSCPFPAACACRKQPL